MRMLSRASSLVYGRCLGIEFAAAEATRSSAVGDEFEHRLQLLLSVADPLEHGADKDIASIISISRCFDLPSRSIARRVTSAARCRLSLSALLTVW
jgi:hypothetical protein